MVAYSLVRELRDCSLHLAPGSWSRVTSWLASLAMFAFVMSGTPGPNNVIFAASGARVGLIRTVPALAGMLIGFAGVIALCAVGIGSAVARSTTAQSVLSLVAAAYMVWLAWRLWTSRPAASQTSETTYVSSIAMLFLQALNPKTWLASLALVSGFLGLNSPGGIWVDALGIACFLAVVAVSATLWTFFGASLRSRLNARRYVIFNRSLSIVAVATALHMLRPLQ